MVMPLEKLLVDKGLVSGARMEQALAVSRKTRRSLITTLVDEKLAGEEDILRAMAEAHGVSFMTLKELAIAPAAVKSISVKIAAHYSVMPVSLCDGVLTVAMSNPFDMSAVEDIETNFGFRVERAYACREDIAEAIRKYYGVGAETVERILDDYAGRGETEARPESHDLERMAGDASVVKLVNQILQQAINDRATDIHFELYDDGVTIRRRIDGVLYDTKMSENINVLYAAMISRIKLMSGLNIVERRLPQDGRARVSIGHRQYDLRISVVPSLHGENIVIRILPTTMLLSLEDLGLTKERLELMTGLLRMPHGIIMVTGPTGSGKSTTLYACLSRLNTRERKIITI